MLTGLLQTFLLAVLLPPRRVRGELWLPTPAAGEPSDGGWLAGRWEPSDDSLQALSHTHLGTKESGFLSWCLAWVRTGERGSRPRELLMTPHPGGSSLRKASVCDQPTGFFSGLSSTDCTTPRALHLFCSLHGELHSYLPALALAVPSSCKPSLPCNPLTRLRKCSAPPPLDSRPQGSHSVLGDCGSGTWPGGPFDLRLWFLGLCLPLPFEHGRLSLNCHFKRGERGRQAPWFPPTPSPPLPSLSPSLL